MCLQVRIAVNAQHEQDNVQQEHDNAGVGSPHTYKYLDTRMWCSYRRFGFLKHINGRDNEVPSEKLAIFRHCRQQASITRRVQSTNQSQLYTVLANYTTTAVNLVQVKVSST